MTSPILVTGGTGLLGGHVVPLLRAAGRDVRVLSRHGREPAEGVETGGVEYVVADLVKGQGVEAALEGVETVLHLAGGAKGDDQAAQNLVRAAASAGVKHIVHISVIGADSVPLAWFRTKHAAENAVQDSGIPWTILRAAQFNDLVFKTAATMAKMPVIPVPGGLRFQPVDAREVAARLAELTLGEPAGLVPDLAGPTVYGMKELIRGYLEASGKHRPTVPMRMPGKAGKAYRAGRNLSVDAADTGEHTWEEFLAEKAK